MALSAEVKYGLSTTLEMAVSRWGFEETAKHSPRRWVEAWTKGTIETSFDDLPSQQKSLALKVTTQLRENVQANQQEAEQFVAGLLGMM